MARPPALSKSQVSEAIALRTGGESLRTIGRRYGVSATTVARALSRTRTADEFDAPLIIRPPQQLPNAYAWNIQAIRNARDDQMQGRFQRPKQLARAFRTDDALFIARRNRLAPHDAVSVKLQAHPSIRGDNVKRRAQEHVIVPRSVLKSIHGTLADHALAIGYIKREPNDDGTIVGFRLKEWPIEHVYWDSTREQLMTYVRNGTPEPILHGNGTWVVFQKYEDQPWTEDAALLPGALVWGAHAMGLSDWAGASTSHGQAKMVGELPPGVAILASKGGKLSPQAQAFLDMIADVANGNVAAGIRPAGSKTEVVANPSNAWQVFSELIVNREKAAARIYLGTDAALGSVGGAPGVDISTLFGVSTTLLQGDFEAIEQGLLTGVFQPWTAINYGDSKLSPRLEYLLPDPDENAKREESAKNEKRLMVAIKARREQRLEINQGVIDELAKKFGVSPAPKIASTEGQTSSIVLAPTDAAKVIRVDEARQSQGLEPLGGAKGQQFLSELEGAAKQPGEQTSPTPTEQ